MHERRRGPARRGLPGGRQVQVFAQRRDQRRIVVHAQGASRVTVDARGEDQGKIRDFRQQAQRLRHRRGRESREQLAVGGAERARELGARPKLREGRGDKLGKIGIRGQAGAARGASFSAVRVISSR